ncbi:hypothetical protein [Variovorax boronicumulans]|uniref:hypothetical protein n=1 Tax=Variovorax boronicumulans TaxID=436515 RepID=UPI003396E8F6
MSERFHPAFPSTQKLRSMARRALAPAFLACIAPNAGAVFTYASTNAPYGITLQVGSAVAVDEVAFNVTGANVGLTPTSVAGSQPITIRISPSRPSMLFAETRPVTLTVDVPAGLNCTTFSSCGNTIIPFSTISWVSTNATSPNQGDIQSGTFANSTTQSLASFNAATSAFLIFNSDTRFMANTLTFRYANTTVYPAGSYRGKVRFTATMV